MIRNNDKLSKIFSAVVLLVIIPAVLFYSHYTQYKEGSASFGQKDIPKLIVHHMYEGQDKDLFVSEALKIINKYAKKPGALSKNDIDNINSKYIQNIINAEKTILIISDIDFDNKVTTQELQDWISNNDSTRKFKFTSIMDRFDVNKDGVVVEDEINSFDYESFDKNYRFLLAELLQFDKDKDGLLETDEFKTLLSKIFYSADVNHDFVLSKEEIFNLVKKEKIIKSNLKKKNQYNIILGKSANIYDTKYQSFKRVLSYSKSFDEYKRKILRLFKVYAGDDNVLDRNDISSFVNNNINNSVAGAFRTSIGILKFDSNRDSILTVEEMTSSNEGNRFNLSDVNLSIYDSNSDKAISFVELYNMDVALSSLKIENMQSKPKLSLRGERLTIFDFNKDSRVTKDEIERVINVIFIKADKDENQVISQDEMKDFMKVSNEELDHLLSNYKTDTKSPDDSNKISEVRSKVVDKSNADLSNHNKDDFTQCGLPKPEEEEIIVAYGAYGGDTLSSVTVVGQDEVTETSKITIEKGDKPIYLILSSFSSKIWQIEGDVKRISKIIASGRVSRIGKVSVGISGIEDQKKVYFISEGNCFTRFSTSGSINSIEAKRQLKREFGKELDIFYRSSRSSNILIPSMKPANKKKEIVSEMISRTNESKFTNLYHFTPGGLLKLDKNKVISSAKVEDYIIYPQEAGLEQLIESGHIKKINEYYKIIKPIEYFPAGLAGAHLVKFVLGKGVSMPKGSPGHSCVISEDTGEALMNQRTCNSFFSG